MVVVATLNLVGITFSDWSMRVVAGVITLVIALIAAIQEGQGHNDRPSGLQLNERTQEPFPD